MVKIIIKEFEKDRGGPYSFPNDTVSIEETIIQTKLYTKFSQHILIP